MRSFLMLLTEKSAAQEHTEGAEGEASAAQPAAQPEPAPQQEMFRVRADGRLVPLLTSSPLPANLASSQQRR